MPDQPVPPPILDNNEGLTPAEIAAAVQTALEAQGLSSLEISKAVAYALASQDIGGAIRIALEGQGLSDKGIASAVSNAVLNSVGSVSDLPELDSDGLTDIDWNAPDSSVLSDKLSDGIGQNRGGFISSWLGSFFHLELPTSVGSDGVLVISIASGPNDGLPSELRCDLTKYSIVSGLRVFLVACNAVMTVVAAVFIYKGTF